MYRTADTSVTTRIFNDKKLLFREHDGVIIFYLAYKIIYVNRMKLCDWLTVNSASVIR